MKDIDETLQQVIKDALHLVEKNGDIVIVSEALGEAAKLIANKTKEAYVGEIFSHEEIMFFGQLATEASHNKNMFHQEMETITNYSQEDAKLLGDKIRTLTKYFHT